ncbi:MULTISPECIES: hypothetical protein [Roseobacteraceae]|uniref:Uncharacterized protein n=1 Tax=Falsiruegeria litorea TaxID=1280831 RepID=A0ABS5WUX7_9RHOB|nr:MULTISPECIES: hypothetical protein [Roseobacteraceae]MBT3142942.1 hypothetical protein [Falsiruegeria litorea]MBT8166953.1 hypothetical protein [Falsiruegeria litorea]
MSFSERLKTGSLIAAITVAFLLQAQDDTPQDAFEPVLGHPSYVAINVLAG